MSTLDNLPRGITLQDTICIYKKRESEDSPVLFCEYDSHEVCNTYSSVVLVDAVGKCLSVRCTRVSNEWIGNHAVASLETNLRLEGLRINAAEHLEGNIWAVE